METENEQKLIFSGRTVEEALQQARDKLGLEPFTPLSYEIVEDTSKKKFLLFGGAKKEVRIQIHFQSKASSDEDSIQQDVKQMVADVWGASSRSEQPEREGGPASRGRGRRYGHGYGPRDDSFSSRRRRDNRGSQTFQGQGPSQRPQFQGPRVQGPPVSEEVMEVVRSQMNTLFQKMGLELTVALERSMNNPAIVRVTPEGADRAWLYEAKGDAVRNVEELVQKMIKTRFGEGERCQLYFVGHKARGGGERRRDHSPRDEEALKQQVAAAIEKVKASGESATVGPFNAYERRLVHRQVEMEQGLVSESSGEGALKMVTIHKHA